MKNSDTKQKTEKKAKTDGQMRYEIRRKTLIDSSVQARQYRAEMVQKHMEQGDPRQAEIWAFKRVNDIIAGWYREKTGATVFKTFWQWKQEGASVKKGEHAFLLWGKKLKKTANAPETESDEPAADEYEFFPLVYLFSDLQVEQSRQEDEHAEPIPPIVKKQPTNTREERKQPVSEFVLD